MEKLVSYDKMYYYRVAIIGSRTYYKKTAVQEVINDLSLSGELEVISGGAKGVDTWAEEHCKEKDIPYNVIRPVNPASKIDYLYRNVEIITLADEIFAFWDGKSKGTKFVIDYAKARGKKITIYNYKGEII